MNRDVKRFPQVLYDRATQGAVRNSVTKEIYIGGEWREDWGRRMGEGGSSNDRRKLSRREWRRAAAAMAYHMQEAGIDPSPDVWQLLSDDTLIRALGPMAGGALTIRRDEFAIQMGRVQRARKKR